MKTKLLSLFAFILFFNLYSQVAFDTHSIPIAPFSDVKAICAADLNNDGYKDLVVSYGSERKIVWLEFNNELKTFDTEHFLSDLYGGRAVIMGDIDNDQDEDIIGADASRIFWFENIDNQGNFGPMQIIATSFLEPTSILFLDMDGDGDKDILGSSLGDPISHQPPTIAWFENSDGQGNFTTKHIIDDSTHVEFYKGICFADLDNDGDPDVIVTGSPYAYGKLGWYKNLDGQGNFSAFQLISNVVGASSVFSIDMNLDGYNDIVLLRGGDVLCFQNLNGQGQFGNPNILITEQDYIISIFYDDLDNDGDIDILGSSNDKIVWYENINGLGDFSSGNIISTSSGSPNIINTADIENDGDIDVVTGSAGHNEFNLFWHENLFILGTEENTTPLFNVFPNPTHNILNISGILPIDEITIYNNLGQSLFTSEEKKTNRYFSLK